MDERIAGNSREKRDGIRLSYFYAVAAVIFAVMAFVLLLSTYLTSRGYSRMEEATERYITAQQAAADMQAGSDYLTAQARAFVATGDLKRVEQFFEETNVTRRRDHALEAIEDLLEDSPTYSYLSAAMDASNQLLEIEHSAMRLAAESYGYGPAALPEELRALKPSEAERALSPEKQRDEALNMLFDETYQNYKDEIRKNVSQSVEVLIGETHQQQRESSDRLLHLIHREEALIVGMLFLALLLILSTALLVSYPLRSYISHIRLDEELPEKGASELRFLARTYNQVREQNLRHSEQLRYDATHDALTGLFNRGVFEKLRSRLEGRDNALLIIDLDRFKEINDRYGHDIGDRALCCVSALLQENFRAEDYICRIGGDEFVVIMVNMNSSLRDLVEEKIRRITETLKTPKDGLPPMSLSVGVAFGDRENPSGDIYKDADTALYRTKTQHRGGCEFY